MAGAAICAAASVGCGAEWSNRDIGLEAAFVTVNTLDTLDTAGDITRRCQCETNPIIGNRGQNLDPVLWGFTSSVLHLIVTDLLPPRWRGAFQGFTIGTETAIVARSWWKGFTP